MTIIGKRQPIQSELANYTSSLVETINIVYVNHLKIKIFRRNNAFSKCRYSVHLFGIKNNPKE